MDGKYVQYPVGITHTLHIRYPCPYYTEYVSHMYDSAPYLINSGRIEPDGKYNTDLLSYFQKTEKPFKFTKAEESVGFGEGSFRIDNLPYPDFK